jgi:hypothetical protein
LAAEGSTFYLVDDVYETSTKRKPKPRVYLRQILFKYNSSRQMDIHVKGLQKIQHLTQKQTK